MIATSVRSQLESAMVFRRDGTVAFACADGKGKEADNQVPPNLERMDWRGLAPRISRASLRLEPRLRQMWLAWWCFFPLAVCSLNLPIPSCPQEHPTPLVMTPPLNLTPSLLQCLLVLLAATCLLLHRQSRHATRAIAIYTETLSSASMWVFVVDIRPYSTDNGVLHEIKVLDLDKKKVVRDPPGNWLFEGLGQAQDFVEVFAAHCFEAVNAKDGVSFHQDFPVCAGETGEGWLAGFGAR
ncbi:hypothetical protein BDK51DRAFT_43176 [Blyttiomyces helicus]|uniref:Uncharacterized protein n=1 Tax=Blyttiomyces helicus TaxID=388810 RepID=A0A4P9W154_9FUNG|nr:hypothetical protein BDK51DRAFT_43176 [Blyttiomyces helicus]|eukprot:RKO84873.1 hypothetical protein BDK51DRAFT_43176 [Blyttiomyces helicus]